MAAITVTKEGSNSKGASPVNRYYGTGAANSADTLTTCAVPHGRNEKLLYVSAAYSASPTQAGVTVTVDSGLGAAYDALVTTGTANAQDTVYLPSGCLVLTPGDAFVVAVPAGGACITAAVTVVTQVV